MQGVGGGEAGLALARTKAPALVLLDIFLPDRSGWRVLQSLKQDPKTQDIPVVVLSVNEDRAHAMALGAAEHMVKPADRDVLAATVMRYARKRPQPQRGQRRRHAAPSKAAQAKALRVVVRRQHARDDIGDALAGRDVQEFVRAVRVRMRAEHAGDQELRVAGISRPACP